MNKPKLLLHPGPWHVCVSRMTSQAQELVIDRLTNYKFSPKHKMQQTDKYRNESFLISVTEIARAMEY